MKTSKNQFFRLLFETDLSLSFVYLFSTRLLINGLAAQHETDLCYLDSAIYWIHKLELVFVTSLCLYLSSEENVTSSLYYLKINGVI